MKCFKTRSQIIRARIEYWEKIKSLRINYYFDLLIEGTLHDNPNSMDDIDRYNRLLTRMYTLLKKKQSI